MDKIGRLVVISPYMNDNNITSNDIKKILRKRYRITVRDAGMITDAVFSALAEYMTKQKTITITRLGTFRVKNHAEKHCFNVHTRQHQTAPAYKTISFKPCEAIKTALNVAK